MCPEASSREREGVPAGSQIDQFAIGSSVMSLGRGIRLGTGVVLSVVALILTGPPAALAKSPPKGVYECTIGGIYADTVKISGKTTYKRFGKSGKYKAGNKKKTFYDAYKGYTIKFKTGPFEGFKGNWHKSGTGINEIALKNPLSGFEDTYCDD